VLSCSKKDDDVTPITEKEIVAEWTMGDPVVNIVVSGHEGDAKIIRDTLKKLFISGDKYTFNSGTTCTVTRGNATAAYPKTYKIDGDYLTFTLDKQAVKLESIKFATNLSGNQLTLTADYNEIRRILKDLVNWSEAGEGGTAITGDGIDLALMAVKTETVVKLVLTKK
jgi:hypothetical protein